MTTVTIPDWHPAGILRPFVYPNSEYSDRSPYPASLEDFVTRFGSSSERRVIIGNLLDYRSRLHKVGIEKGFQWIDGSFVEHIERRKNRAPGDMDVVTFLHPPEGMSEAELAEQAPDLFLQHKQIKENLFLDTQFIFLDETPENIIAQVTYWYGLLSHQRETELWKGFVALDLNSTKDSSALKVLQHLSGG